MTEWGSAKRRMKRRLRAVESKTRSGRSLIPELGFLCIQIPKPVNPGISAIFPHQSEGTDTIGW